MPRSNRTIQLIVVITALHSSSAIAVQKSASPPPLFRVIWPSGGKDAVKSPSDIVVNDRLFDGLTLSDNMRDDAERLGFKKDASKLDSSLPSGKFSNTTMERCAFDKFLRQAAALGIKEREINRAMMEGRFNPDPIDMIHAYDGSAELTAEDILEGRIEQFSIGLQLAVHFPDFPPEIQQALIDKGVITRSRQVTERNITKELLQYVFDNKLIDPKTLPESSLWREIRWTERFGEITSLREVQTLVNGAPAVISHPTVRLGRATPYNYFEFGSMYFSGVPARQPEPKNYVDLRLQRYLPRLRVLAFKHVEAQRKKAEDHKKAIIASIKAVREIVGTEITVDDNVSNETWNETDDLAAQRFVKTIQREAIFGWDGPTNGIYSAAFAAHFKLWLEGADEQDETVRTLRVFMDAMEVLNAAHLYTPRVEQNDAEDAIYLVRQMAIEAGVPMEGENRNGPWKEADDLAAQAIILRLQEEEALHWTGSTDGVYTPAFAAHFADWLSSLDESNDSAINLRRFKAAMDFLSEAKIYTPRLTEQEVTSQVSAPLSAGDMWRAGVLAWFNGFAWEYGDEFIAWSMRKLGKHEKAASFEASTPDLMHRVLGYSRASWWRQVALSVIGHLMSALGVLVIVIFGYKEQRVPVTAFILAFSAEVIEGVICYAGEVNTMGPLPITIAFRVTILCALVTGLYASSISGKGPKDAARLVKFDGGAALLGGLIVMGTFFL